MATEIDQTITKIDKVLRERGSAYSCKRVSWEDCSRGTSGGQLSSLGSNITDVRLTARDGRVLYTVRTDNFNEKIGRVDARAVGLLDADGAPTTLREVLRRAASTAPPSARPTPTCSTRTSTTRSASASRRSFRRRRSDGVGRAIGRRASVARVLLGES